MRHRFCKKSPASRSSALIVDRRSAITFEFWGATCPEAIRDFKYRGNVVKCQKRFQASHLGGFPLSLDSVIILEAVSPSTGSRTGGQEEQPQNEGQSSKPPTSQIRLQEAARLQFII
ncbi:Fc.00g036220.m01.CDS01 [Cosmosporella sp. VM-42]